LVPKNSKGCRTISGEAVRLMWAQLGLDSLMRKKIEDSYLTSKTIHLSDQSVNAKLALSASKTGRMATLDLTAASDGVSVKLIYRCFPTEWRRAMMSVRSTGMQLPSGDVIKLNMMSPMGNGFTFSMQTLLFWALSAATIAYRMEETYTSEDDLEWACHNTFVYGDDIIVPREYACEVMSSLERYGFLINRDKSFWTGPFRESCGIDAFAGTDITPLKIKTPPQTRGESNNKKNVDATFVASWYAQSKDWATVLPRVSAWMKAEVYAELGFTPTYPEGWEGCIGEPTPYERVHGRPVEVGQLHVSHFQKVVRGPLVRVPAAKGGHRFKAGFLMLRDYTPPPSDGKLVKVVRVKPVQLRAPLDAFPEELEYFRCLQTIADRKGIEIDPCDSRTFTLRYSAKVVIHREWLS